MHGTRDAGGHYEMQLMTASTKDLKLTASKLLTRNSSKDFIFPTCRSIVRNVYDFHALRSTTKSSRVLISVSIRISPK